MLVQIITENGQKKVIPLTADAGAGLPVGFIAPAYKKGNYSGWLYLDGRDTTGTSEELSTHYPILYAFLGSNKLPDYREFALVGAEENTTDVYNASTNPTGTIHDHDVYTEGQAKDDRLQNITGSWYGERIVLSGSAGGAVTQTNSQAFNLGSGENGNQHTLYSFDASRVARTGTTTRGKRKAVYFYIKATSGLSENAQDNVINTLNEERSYSTEEVNTGKKWIDGKPIYRKVWTNLNYTLLPNNWFITDISNSGYDTITEIKVMNNVGTLFNFVGCSRDIGNTLQLWSTRNVNVEMNILVLEYTKTTD